MICEQLWQCIPLIISVDEKLECFELSRIHLLVFIRDRAQIGRGNAMDKHVRDVAQKPAINDTMEAVLESMRLSLDDCSLFHTLRQQRMDLRHNFLLQIMKVVFIFWLDYLDSPH